MRDLKECKAEVFRRSENRIIERRKRLNRALAFCVPLFLVVTVWSVTRLPAVINSGINGVSTADGGESSYINESPAASAENSQSIVSRPDSFEEDGHINCDVYDGQDLPDLNPVTSISEPKTNFPNKNNHSTRGDSEMKITRTCTIFISLLLVIATALNAFGCSAFGKMQAENLTESITPNKVGASNEASSPNYEGAVRTFSSKDAAVTDFAIRLFKASEQSGENTLISPLSVLCALAMTANGAEGETLKQMEKVLGMTAEELNCYIYEYMNNLPNGDKYKLSLADSVWFNDSLRLVVNKEFLQTVADYYGADVFKARFDEQTRKDINNWVKEKTEGMIPEILDEISQESKMYLVNALAFEAEWAEKYTEDQIRIGTFTKADGTRQKAEFMYNVENVYLEDKNATGFMKYYSDRKYAFVAMLPNEGVSVSDYIASLDGESLNALLKNPVTTSVETSVPGFETEYGTDEMGAVLSQMGMPKAFDDKSAEFGRLFESADGHAHISRIIHKTFISLTENGTKAGASTVVEIKDAGNVTVINGKKVYLNRPFVYMLIDCEKNIPFFIGTMTDIEK